MGSELVSKMLLSIRLLFGRRMNVLWISIAALAAVCFIGVLIVFVPYVVLGAINALIPGATIEFTFSTWLAVVVLWVVFGR